MADGAVEVIYKGWLKKAIVSETKKKSFLSRHQSSSTWKKRYFVLLRRHDDDEGEECPFMCIYEKEPATEAETPKASLKLWPHYRVDKKHDETGKVHSFEVRTPDDNLRLLAETETNMDLWVFYLQIQTKLRQDFPGYCFEVTPDESDPMRRIGAKGSKCLLHVSQWGLTLALKRTRSLLAQWPLKSIRIFESSETGAFSFEAGRSAPMGEARYLFGTNPGEDGRVYDLLDAYTTEMQNQRNDGSTDPSQPATEEEVVKEYQTLRLATFGLLSRRSSSVRSAGSPAASMAVPVPVPHSRGPAAGYDRLHRAQEEVARQQSDGLPCVVPPRTQGIPIRRNPDNPTVGLRSTGPPLPPRQEGLKSPPSSFQRSYSERGHSLERYGRSFDRHDYPLSMGEEPYTTMTASSMLSREPRCHRSLTESDMLQMARSGESFGNIFAAEKFGRMLSNRPGSGMSEYEAMALRLGHNPYQNSGVSLLPNSYENTPLISPSPQDAVFPGFPNMGFVSSPHSVESGPPILPRKYQPPNRTSVAVDVHTDASGRNQHIRHTYFQHQFNKGAQSPASVYMSPHSKAGTQIRPPHDLPAYSTIKGGVLGSHQYQEVYLYNSPYGTLRRSMSMDHLFRVRSLSVSSSMSSALSVGSPLLGSLDLATSRAQSARIPIWMGSRQLPSPPPPGTPELNAYCGSPRAPFPAFADFGAFAAGPTPYDEIRGKRNSFNNNNQRQSAGSASSAQAQMLAASLADSERDARVGQDASLEEGYLEPIFQMKRSRSEADILNVVSSEDATARGKKSQHRSRSKSKGLFATLRKRTNSNPNISKDGAVPIPSGCAADAKPSKTAVAALLKRTQSNPDLLDERPVLPTTHYKQHSDNVSAVKPAIHSTVTTQGQRKKKFDFSLKIFRQTSKSSDRDERDDSGGSEDDKKSERRSSKSSPVTQARSVEKGAVSPGVKGIVASDKAISFRKAGPQPLTVRQSPSPEGKPAVGAKPSVVSSTPTNVAFPHTQPHGQVEVSMALPAERAARDRLSEVANRPLPSPPRSNSQPPQESFSQPHVKRFIPGMKRNPQVLEAQQSTPPVKTNRVKKAPPPPPPRDPNISLDSISRKSSRSNSNASDHANSAIARRSSSEIKSARRTSFENVSLRLSRADSNGLQYENTDFGSLPVDIGTPPGSFSARNSGISLDGVRLGKSPSFSEADRQASIGSSSLRSSRANSVGSQYENTDFRSLPADVGTPPAQVDSRGSPSPRTSGISFDSGRVGRPPSFTEADRRTSFGNSSPRSSLTNENTAL